ncbi:hypothetical protein EDD22DRAFT_312070 [Suillus occidentalis]|nr:hypothetical protein EDD22DRAFT_312070 [Suillus occidentalis]
MELPSKAVQSGSSLTTKQRIAAGSGPCVAPKPKPLQTIPKLLTNLTFKKKPPEAKDPPSATSLASKKTLFENEPLSASSVQPSGSLNQEPSSTTISFQKKPFENEPFSASDIETGPSATTPVGASPSSATKQTTKEPSVIAPGWEYNAETFEAVDDNPPPPSSAPLIQHQLAKPAPPRRAPQKAADDFLQSLSLDMPGYVS